MKIIKTAKSYHGIFPDKSFFRHFSSLCCCDVVVLLSCCCRAVKCEVQTRCSANLCHQHQITRLNSFGNVSTFDRKGSFQNSLNYNFVQNYQLIKLKSKIIEHVLAEQHTECLWDLDLTFVKEARLLFLGHF